MHPRQGRKRRRKYVVYDIETWGLDAKKFAFGVTYDGLDFKVFYDPKEMWAYMRSRRWRGHTWYAHNALYDAHAFLDNVLIDLEKPIVDGGRLIIGKIHSGKNTIKFSDSMCYFNTSLEKLGESIGVPKGKTPDKFKKGVPCEITEEDVEYCRQDCRVVYEAIKLFDEVVRNIAHVEPGLTVSSTAMSDYRQNHQPNVFFRNEKSENLWWRAYYGGRVQVVHIGHHDFQTNMKEYDRNSMYPYEGMGPMPDPNKQKYIEGPSMEFFNQVLADDKMLGACRVTVDISERTDTLYPLPIRRDGGLRYDYGHWTGEWVLDELRNAISHGVKVVSVEELTYGPSANIGLATYFRKWYDKRLEYKASGNTACADMCKLMMNGLVGKFGERRHLQEPGTLDFRPEGVPNHWLFTPAGEHTDYGYWHPDGDVYAVTDHTYFCICATVTARSRMALYNRAVEVGDVYYMDTDSLHTTNTMETGQDIGEWKLEGEFVSADYAGKKIYHLVYADGKCKNRYKGVSKEALKHYSIWAKEITFTRIMKPREALRRGVPAGTPVEVIKRPDFEAMASNTTPICLTGDEATNGGWKLVDRDETAWRKVRDWDKHIGLEQDLFDYNSIDSTIRNKKKYTWREGKEDGFW